MTVEVWERCGVPLTSSQASRQGWVTVKLCPLCHAKWQTGVNLTLGVFKCHKCGVTTDAAGVYALLHDVDREAAKAALGKRSTTVVDVSFKTQVHPRQMDAFDH